MITLEIRTLFGGKCAIHEKYIRKAKREKKGLKLLRYIREGNVMKEQIMTIPYEDVESRIAYKNGPHKEMFGSGTYKLVYYKWEPVNLQIMRQEKLL